MSKFSKKSVLSAKDSISTGTSAIKIANAKMTKIAQDMEIEGIAPDPAQVKEIVDSIAAVAQEIVQKADEVSTGLDEVVAEPIGDDPPIEDDPPVVNTLDEETKNKIAALEDDNKDLKEFKETSEKEKMATTYGNLFPAAQKQAKYTEFMKMDKPNSELSTVLNATENVFKSATKVASSEKSNEITIFTESNQKNASMQGFSGNARTLSEI